MRDEKCIDCGISIDALAIISAPSRKDDPLPAFRKHRERIQEIAMKLIAVRRFEDDGALLIRSPALQQT